MSPSHPHPRLDEVRVCEHLFVPPQASFPWAKRRLYVWGESYPRHSCIPSYNKTYHNLVTFHRMILLLPSPRVYLTLCLFYSEAAKYYLIICTQIILSSPLSLDDIVSYLSFYFPSFPSHTQIYLTSANSSVECTAGVQGNLEYWNQRYKTILFTGITFRRTIYISIV